MRAGCVLLLWLFALTRLPAELSSFSTSRKFFVQAPVPEVVQRICMWAEEGHRRLEKQLGERIPFQRNVPLYIRFAPEQDGVALVQSYTNQVYLQRILCSTNLVRDHVPLADALARCFLQRIVLSKRATEDTRIAPLPDWLVLGTGQTLLPGQREPLDGLVRLWRAGTLDPPEQLAQRHLDARNPVHRGLASLLLRWTLDRSHGQDLRNTLWHTLAQGRSLDALWWTAHLPQASSLRDVHVSWDLWMAGEAERASYGKPETLQALLTFRLAEMGVGGAAVDRYTPLRLHDVADQLQEPWANPVLQNWIVRVQRTAFQQPPEYLELTENYMEAVRALLQRDQKRYHAAIGQADAALADALAK